MAVRPTYIRGTGHERAGVVHLVRLHRSSTGTFFAGCSCGWKGPNRVVAEKAAELGRDHHDRATT